MDPYEFEHLIADLWEEMGFQTEVIQQSQDKGIDIRATNQLGQKHLIQVKRHGPNSVVGDPKIREYAGLYRQENGVDEVYVVTTNGFTSQARDTADSVGVELVDDERLITLIAQNDENQILSGHLAKSKPGSNSDSGGLQSIASSDNETNTATTGSRHSIPNSQTVTPADIELSATLRGEDLSDATLTDANLSDADLSYAENRTPKDNDTNSAAEVARRVVTGNCEVPREPCLCRTAPARELNSS
jgi:hypothetical protein